MTYEQRLEQYGPMKNPPFNSRETYLAWAADWKKRYAELSEKIRRSRRRDRLIESAYAITKSVRWSTQVSEVAERLNRSGLMSKADVELLQTNFDHGTWSMGTQATAMIAERHESKVSAQQQWLAAQEARKAA